MGRRISAVALVCPSASASVRMPTRPAYIRKIIITLEAAFRCTVVSSVRPVLLTAETHSNSTALKGSAG